VISVLRLTLAGTDLKLLWRYVLTDLGRHERRLIHNSSLFSRVCKYNLEKNFRKDYEKVPEIILILSVRIAFCDSSFRKHRSRIRVSETFFQEKTYVLFFNIFVLSVIIIIIIIILVFLYLSHFFHIRKRKKRYFTLGC